MRRSVNSEWEVNRGLPEKLDFMCLGSCREEEKCDWLCENESHVAPLIYKLWAVDHGVNSQDNTNIWHFKLVYLNNAACYRPPTYTILKLTMYSFWSYKYLNLSNLQHRTHFHRAGHKSPCYNRSLLQVDSKTKKHKEQRNLRISKFVCYKISILLKCF